MYTDDTVPVLLYAKMSILLRTQNGDLRTSWDEMKLPTWDLPEKIVEESIKVHLKILTGYKGNPKTDQQKFREALTPRHMAISLTGEPTLYGYIGEQIQAFHRRGFTTFLVTNGTNPSILAKLRQEPTQLYTSVYASDEATFKRVCRPQVPKAWEKAPRDSITSPKLQMSNCDSNNCSEKCEYEQY